MAKKIWINWQTRLFMIKDNMPQYLYHIYINDIFWKSDIVRKCDFCGSIRVNKLECPNCGNTTSAGSLKVDLGQAIVVFAGYLPSALTIFEISNAISFDLMLGECGDPGDYWSNAPIMRFSNLEIVNRRIANPMAIHCDEQAPLTMFVTMMGDVEVFPDHFMSFEEYRAYINGLDIQAEGNK